MPLSELVRYFNIADSQGDSTLYQEGGRVAAWHEGLRLGSQFTPIVDLKRERIVGHQASLTARLDDGSPLVAKAAYARNRTDEAIVHFDRLVRTLHALNFLGQQQHAGGFLLLSVNSRHLRAVPNQHGLVYEAILKRCGLAPADIVLEIDHRELSTCSHLSHALQSYRQRGYRLALQGVDHPAAAMQALQLNPDIIRLGAESFEESADLFGQSEVTRLQEGIDGGERYRAVRASGIQLGQGKLFGEPHSDCRATHAGVRVAYNSASFLGVPS